jgi:hypothetical protein
MNLPSNGELDPAAPSGTWCMPGERKPSPYQGTPTERTALCRLPLVAGADRAEAMEPQFTNTFALRKGMRPRGSAHYPT